MTPGRCGWELLAFPGPQLCVCADLRCLGPRRDPSCKAWGLGLRAKPVLLLTQPWLSRNVLLTA